MTTQTSDQSVDNERVGNTILTPKEVVPANIGKSVLEPLNHGIAASLQTALKMGIQAHEVVELLMNQLTSVVALIEPAGAREATTVAIGQQLSGMIAHYVQKRQTTPGGVILPEGTKP